MRLSPKNQRWLDGFRKRHGRSPRILHIGNIANNAYNNARLLNEAGLDCDVICYDYYHVMGCPEWEDADFSSSSIKDDFRPDWRSINLNGYQRPVWFAQGPVQLCIKYLLARRASDPIQAGLWAELEMANHATPIQADLWAELGITNHTRPGASIYLIKEKTKRIAGAIKGKFNEYIWPMLNDAPADLSAKLLTALNGTFRGTSTVFMMGLCLLLISVARLATWPMRILATWPGRMLIARFWQQTTHTESGPDIPWLVAAFIQEFEGRPDKLTAQDVLPYLGLHKIWTSLFSCYDYVIGYSTDPIIPLMSGKPYFAFEHGTIRTIPFEPTSQGRLTALAYRMSQHVFVTNFDCVGSAEKLAHGKFTTINHPYDEDHGLRITGFEQLRNQLKLELDSDFVFFHPTRQDWVEGTGYADKSNDVFLRAFAELRRQGLRVGLVACAWGSSVAQSKALLDELGCLGYVRWVPPMAITPFERMCRAADIVVDQFKLGAFGGVVFKAMAVGTPILTYLDETRLARQYVECPPVVNCRTTDEIVVKLKPLVSSSGELAKAGEASRAWMKKYHAKEMTVNAQIDQFRRHPPMS